MEPKMFRLSEDEFPIYYSLNVPSTLVFSPKSRRNSKIVFEMRELFDLMKTFLEALSRGDTGYADTMLYKIATKLEFLFVHNENDVKKVIQDASIAETLDPRFQMFTPGCHVPGAKFPQDAAFFRGSVIIRPK
jgi:hypothetical protein